MSTVNITLDEPDWIILRQSLSLALLSGKDACIRGGVSFLDDRPQFLPLYKDLEIMITNTGLGEIETGGDDILFRPGTVRFGSFEADSGVYSSTAELLLFLLPSLFYCDFRSALALRGVTHGILSYPVSYINNTLFAVLERAGFYGGLILKRFGFYGSGGGAVDIKVYPNEAVKNVTLTAGSDAEKISARVFISGISGDIAKRQKEYICTGLGLTEDRVSIIEVIDSDGYGNSVQITCELAGIPVVVYADIPVYNEAGDFIFDEDIARVLLDRLIKRAGDVAAAGSFPDSIVREVLPIVAAAGTTIDCGHPTPLIEKTNDLCSKFL